MFEINPIPQGLLAIKVQGVNPNSDQALITYKDQVNKERKIQHCLGFPNLNIPHPSLLISLDEISYKVFISFSNTEEFVTPFKRFISQTFFSICFFFHEKSRFTRQQRKEETIPLLLSSSFTHLRGTYTLVGKCFRELTSAHGQQAGSNREPLVTERKSLTAKLRTIQTYPSLKSS